MLWNEKDEEVAMDTKRGGVPIEGPAGDMLPAV